MAKEAKARIKIDKLLKEAGWRLLDNQQSKANVQVEITAKGAFHHFNRDNFERNTNRADYVLFCQKDFPLAVLEAKKGTKNPLDGKEQARKYAKELNVRFIFLSNGDSHFFWDLEEGNPSMITQFPTQASLEHRKNFHRNVCPIADEKVEEDYIALTKNPSFKNDPRYTDTSMRSQYLRDQELPILRPYQLAAVHTLQKATTKGDRRFLFEMATGTGKTLVSAAVIKLFLRTGNARRILFLVDRLTLEKQALENLSKYLGKDYHNVIYKYNRDDWQKAEIVISTVQSLTSQNKFKQLFSPTDFDLVIVDEAHRSISGNPRALFEYFVGYKLGLTATPRDYLKNIDIKKLSQKDPRVLEERTQRDTYTTFGCSSGEPTFRYSLNDGVRDGYLVSPMTVDARTNVTTEMLSEKGYSIMTLDKEGHEQEKKLFRKDFEKRFVSENTNYTFCKTFLDNALRDPFSNEIGKSLVFCVSQNHASKVTQILNEIASEKWPHLYQSDFAVQVTSSIGESQKLSIQFSHNNLHGHTRFLEEYKSSKTRVCVTVAMMTTGYDCKDLLNIVFMRPVFSPTEFIQMKGRGTRKYQFTYSDAQNKTQQEEKTMFKLFDFFGNCEFFEEKYNYDEVLKPPKSYRDHDKNSEGPPWVEEKETIVYRGNDPTKSIKETYVGKEGMKIDRKFFEKARVKIQQDEEIKGAVKKEQWDQAIQLVKEKYENKPELYLTLEKIRTSAQLDRKITWLEVLEFIFGRIDTFKKRREKIEDECTNFIAIHTPKVQYVPYIKKYIKAYLNDPKFRKIIKNKEYGSLSYYAGYSMNDFGKLGSHWQKELPIYIENYIDLHTYEEEKK